ncbi:unnamed protein product [Urochloa humidicola]
MTRPRWREELEEARTQLDCVVATERSTTIQLGESQTQLALAHEASERGRKEVADLRASFEAEVRTWKRVGAIHPTDFRGAGAPPVIESFARAGSDPRARAAATEGHACGVARWAWCP